MEFAVEEVPPVSELGDGPGRLGSEPIPFGRADTASGADPASVVIYRRPLEARARDRDMLGALVHDTVVEQVATLLGLSPETVDPGYDERGLSTVASRLSGQHGAAGSSVSGGQQRPDPALRQRLGGDQRPRPGPFLLVTRPP
ncbi:hypothetical protein GCM10020219_024110 [Nonomuraea dietziae]